MKFGNNRGTGHMIDVLFTLALFCVFSLSALLVVLIGANVYKGTVARMNQNYDTRTSLTYVAAKVRQHDVAGGVLLAQLQDCDALLLEQEIEGSRYQTWIYHYDGALRELFTRADSGLGPEAGREIMPLDSFDLQLLAQGLVQVQVQNGDGASSRILIGARSQHMEEGVAP